MQCDYFGCSLIAVGTFPILDEDGEDQGTEALCEKHSPSRLQSSPETVDALDKWIKGLRKSDLIEITDPLEYEQVVKLVNQTESLNQIQNNIRNHKSL